MYQRDLAQNLEDLHEDIAKDALDYIHPGEVILTYGASETIKCFLIAAKKRDPKRHFDVLVASSRRQVIRWHRVLLEVVSTRH